MAQEEENLKSLPDNAYRELAPGEEYHPIMPAGGKPKEVTVYSVTFGIIMAVIFSAAAAYHSAAALLPKTLLNVFVCEICTICCICLWFFTKLTAVAKDFTVLCRLFKRIL